MKGKEKKNLVIPTTDENEVQHKLSYVIGWNANAVALHVKKMETIQMFLKQKMDKLWSIHTMEYY